MIQENSQNLWIFDELKRTKWALKRNQNIIEFEIAIEFGFCKLSRIQNISWFHWDYNHSGVWLKISS